MSETPEQEVVNKLKSLLQNRFHNDTHAAFSHYSRGSDKANFNDLMNLLKDADIGNFLTRGIWAKKIMDVVDQNKDGFVSESELMAVLHE